MFTLVLQQVQQNLSDAKMDPRKKVTTKGLSFAHYLETTIQMIRSHTTICCFQAGRSSLMHCPLSRQVSTVTSNSH